MNKTSIILGLTVFAIVGISLASKPALAYRGDPAVEGPNCTEDRHVEMEAAFENKDYNTWKTLMNGKGRVTQIVTADNFAKFAEAHELAEQGKIEEANKIRAELGLGTRNGAGMGQRMGYGKTNR
jgi:hypothetical protein